MLGRLSIIFGEERENYINLGDYGKDNFIIDDRMLEEQEAERFVESLSEQEREMILQLPYEEQLKVVDEYMKKFEEKEKKHDKKRT